MNQISSIKASNMAVLHCRTQVKFDFFPISSLSKKVFSDDKFSMQIFYGI